ncbi:MAG: type II secretion system protein [Candidatus Pelagadaptatus aseana]|uniref:PulJ/GspJ family protein n=1 Tax=Candidatus Pelagadaptatus aseana TaxID=3120508 RepID=UPI0039B2AD3F
MAALDVIPHLNPSTTSGVIRNSAVIPNECEGSNDRIQQQFYQKQSGLTLVELIAVIIVLAIVGTIGFGFVGNTMETYASTIERGKLVAKGRAALERMARQLRGAAPNSIRITGNCVEFLPVAGGGNYIGDVPDTANGAAPSGSAVTTPIATAPHAVSLWTARYVVIGALDEAELYDTQVSLADLAGRTATSLTLTADKQWLRNSLNRRFYLVDNPQAFCVTAGSLRFHASGYATPSTSTGTPAGAGDLMAGGVSVAAPFVLSPGTEDRNATLSMSLQFSEGGEGIVLNQEVLIRNVP